MKLGAELIKARHDVKAENMNLGWNEWCSLYVNLPGHSIERFIRDSERAHQRERSRCAAKAATENPALFRKVENTPKTTVEQSAPRAAALHRARIEGARAFRQGVPQCDCPYQDDPQRYAAWRTGWCEMELWIKYGSRFGTK